MDFASLQSHLVTEAAALRAAASRAEPDARVPSCPDWTTADLLDHVTEVYDHKTLCMRLVRDPEDEELTKRRGTASERFDAALADLLAEFDSRTPEDLSFTWYGPDQTVGFWIRRMAAETVVHRADAELAEGEGIGPVDPALGDDGVDEYLRIHLAWSSRRWREYVSELLESNAGLAVGIDTGSRAWTVRVGTEGVEIDDGLEGQVRCTVQSPPGETLMWLWRRLPAGAVAVDGDRTAATSLYEMLAPFND